MRQQETPGVRWRNGRRRRRRTQHPTGAAKIKWLAAGIGGGLTFAAVSDTCAMGMLSAKLPYNRGKSCDAESIVAELSSAATPSDADPVQSTAVR